MIATRLVVDGTMRRVSRDTSRQPADLNSAASFFQFVASRAGLDSNLSAALLSDYAQVLGHDADTHPRACGGHC